MKRDYRFGKQDKRRAFKRASKNPTWMNDVASSLYRKPLHQFSRGAASPVRHLVKDGIAQPTRELEAQAS